METQDQARETPSSSSFSFFTFFYLQSLLHLQVQFLIIFCCSYQKLLQEIHFEVSILLLLIIVSVSHHQEVTSLISAFLLNELVLRYRRILQASFVSFTKKMSEVVFIIHQTYIALKPIWNHLHTNCSVPSIFISSRHSAIVTEIFNWNDSYFFQKEAAILLQNYLFQLQK